MTACHDVTNIPNDRRWLQHISEIRILHISQILESQLVPVDIIQLQNCPSLVLAPENNV